MSDGDYNYPDFADHVAGGGTSRFDAFADRLHAGAKAPSFPLTRVDDAATVELAELWRRDPVVAEFGSFT